MLCVEPYAELAALEANDKFVQSKAMSAFLSGEMSDTVQMNPAGAYGSFL